MRCTECVSSRPMFDGVAESQVAAAGDKSRSRNPACWRRSLPLTFLLLSIVLAMSCSYVGTPVIAVREFNTTRQLEALVSSRTASYVGSVYGIPPEVLDAQLQPDGQYLFNYNVSFVDIQRSQVPGSLGAAAQSLEWKIKFARIVRVSSYFVLPVVSSSEAPGGVSDWLQPPSPMQLVIMPYEEPEKFDHLKFIFAHDGYMVIQVHLRERADPHDYVRDLLLVLGEVHAESAAPDSPLCGLIGDQVTFLGFGVAGESALMVPLQPIMFQSYDLRRTWKYVGFAAISPTLDLEGVQGGAVNLPANCSVLITSGDTDCLYSPRDHPLALYGSIPGTPHLCKSYLRFMRANRCQFTTPTPRPDPPPPGLKTCIEADFDCGARPTTPRAETRTRFKRLVRHWMNGVMRNNQTAWSNFALEASPNPRVLPQGQGLFTVYQDCIKFDQLWSGSRP